jgi:hypothetical protein
MHTYVVAVVETRQMSHIPQAKIWFVDSELAAVEQAICTVKVMYYC